MISHRNNLHEAVQVCAEDLVKGTLRLLSPPDVFIRLSRMVDDPSCSAGALARTIMGDPVLSARLLRLANSPFYGFPSRIDTIGRAVTVIGTRALRDLVLAVSAPGIFARMPILDMRAFWEHSLRTATLARLLAGRCKLAEPESLFAAGLLHDVGQLIILAKLPEIGRETRWRARDCGLELHMVEQEVIGFDHAEVGGELLRQWQLPRNLWEAVSCHHSPATARDRLAASIVCLADLLAHELPDAGTPEARRQLSEWLMSRPDFAPVLQHFGRDAGDLKQLREELLRQGAPLEEILLAA
jgi:putative nucleotidyltransferase with HDIG domain